MNTIELKETMTSDNIKPSSDTSSAKTSQASNSSSEEVRAVRSYTVDDRGILNNFAVMPKMYIEEPDTSKPKNFKFQLIAVLSIIVAMIAIAIAVS